MDEEIGYEEIGYEPIDYSVDELQSYFNEDMVPIFPILLQGVVDEISECKRVLRLSYSPELEIEVPTIVHLASLDKTFFDEVQLGDCLWAPCQYAGWEWLKDDKLRLAHFIIIP